MPEREADSCGSTSSRRSGSRASRAREVTPQLGEHVAQVGVDGPRRQEHLFCDLFVRHPLSDEARHLQLLRCQLRQSARLAPTDRLAGGTELRPCTVGPAVCAYGLEHRQRDAEVIATRRHAADVDEGARPEVISVRARSKERLVPACSRRASAYAAPRPPDLGQQCPTACGKCQRPWRSSGGGEVRKASKCRLRLLGATRPDTRLDEVGGGGQHNERMPEADKGEVPSDSSRLIEASRCPRPRSSSASAHSAIE